MQDSNQSVNANMEVTTVAAASVAQLLTSDDGFAGLQVSCTCAALYCLLTGSATGYKRLLA